MKKLIIPFILTFLLLNCEAVMDEVLDPDNWHASPCFDTWTLKIYGLNSNGCEGDFSWVQVKEDEKNRVLNILNNSNEDCIRVSVVHYVIDDKKKMEGYIKNPSYLNPMRECD
jgi:hypothetical protein